MKEFHHKRSHLLPHPDGRYFQLRSVLAYTKVIRAIDCVPKLVLGALLLALVHTSLLSWEYRLPGTACSSDSSFSYSGAVAVRVDSIGNVYVAGWNKAGTPEDHFTVVKLSGGTGKELWHFQTQGTCRGRGCSSQAMDLVLDRGGDVVASGYLNNLQSVDAFVVKLRGDNGRPIWQNEIQRNDASRNAMATAILTDTAKNVIAVGAVTEPFPIRISAAVKLEAAAGNEVWRYAPPDNLNLFGPYAANAAGLDLNDDLVVGGHGMDCSTVSTTGCFSRSFVAKVSGLDGTELWRQPSEPGGSWQIKLDPAGDVLVIEERMGGGPAGYNDWEIAKYAGMTGNRIWKTNNVTPYAWINAMSLTSSFDVVAVGFPFLVSKIRGHDGEFLWQSNGFPGHSGSMAQAVGIDAWDNPIVAGRVADNDYIGDFAVARMSGDDGRVLWTRTISGFPGKDDVALALAIDGEGNPIAAGQISTGLECGDFFVVKLKGENGEDFPVDKKELIAAVEESVSRLSISVGMKRSLLVKLETAAHLLSDSRDNNDSTVANLLEAFLAEVLAQRDKSISLIDAAPIVTAVEELLGLMGDPQVP